MCSRAQLNETFAVLDQLCRIVQNPQPPDVQIIKNVASYKVDIRKTATENEANIKKIIMDYQEKVTALEDQVTNPPAKKFDMQQEILADELNQVQNTIRSLEGQVTKLETSIEALRTTQKSLQEEREVVFEKGDQEQSGYLHQIAFAETQLKLLQSICPITFDETCDEHEIRGEVHLAGLGEIKPFSFSTQELTQGEISERLWEYLWEEQREKNIRATQV